MSNNRVKSLYRMGAIALLCLAIAHDTFARFGGAGGHGGGGYSGGGGSGYGGGGGGLIIWLFSSPLGIVVLIIAIAYYVYTSKNKGGGGEQAESNMAATPTVPFPEGLDSNKVATSFMAMQDAWMRKDVTNVRKWLSDGMYQRLATQFKMMNILGQKNILGNIQIHGIKASATNTDGHYQTVEVAISFSMDDSFVSDKYPQFNESYGNDTDVEYWTFIKRTDSDSEKNLYSNNNCPNCGAPFEVKMGEISRCSNCNTLTNSAAYDWVLSEVTQADDYNGGAGLSNDRNLSELMKNDPFFAVQRIEDIASNIFMQVMDFMTGSDEKRLTRFADDATISSIVQQKRSTPPYVFDRLYLNDVTLRRYVVDGDIMKLYVDLKATCRRVALHPGLEMLDDDFVTRNFSIELSRSIDVSGKANKAETVYSYECSSCGAPYTDTTDDKCTYCDAPVIDKGRNWVLTRFA